MGIALWWQDGEGKPHPLILERGDFFIGRLTDQDMVKLGLDVTSSHFQVYIFSKSNAHPTGLYDATVSRRHAKLSLSHGFLTLQDYCPEGKGSTNGTFVNNVRIGTAPHSLSEGMWSG